MNLNEEIKDDFLRKLVKQVPLESPSDDFTSGVMAGLQPLPEIVKEKKPFFLFLRSVGPWVCLGLFLIIFLISSDIPYLTFIPGKEYVNDRVMPLFASFFSNLAELFTGNKSVSIMLSVMVAGAFLFGIDRVLHRMSTSRNHIA